jgi:hypothetical protein
MILQESWMNADHPVVGGAEFVKGSWSKEVVFEV